MHGKIILSLIILAYPLWGQTSPHPATESELAAIMARGRALAEYDAAAWHASDALAAIHPDKSTIQRYVARKTDKGWVVVWGKYNDAGTALMISYSAEQNGDSDTYTVTKHDPQVADSEFYLHAAKAHELAFKQFFNDVKPQRPYNISVMPAENGQWYVYAIPGQTDAAILPYGGDVRYTVSADGSRLLGKRQMHQTVLEEHVGNDPQVGIHTHVLSEVPEDSDVFYALTRKAARGDWIITRPYVYEFTLPGTLKYIGATEEVANLVDEGKLLDLEEPFKGMILRTIHRLLQGTSSGSPLEVFTTFAGARCTDKTLWLTFSSIIHNVGEKKIILYKDPLRYAQARFGTSATDILAGKYEKLVFASLVAGGKVDLSNDSSFIALGPGMVHTHEQEYPMLGIDMNGKTEAQFLFFTWPPGQEKEVEAQRSRLQNAGDLYSDTLLTEPISLKIDPNVLQKCATAK